VDVIERSIDARMTGVPGWPVVDDQFSPASRAWSAGRHRAAQRRWLRLVLGGRLESGRSTRRP
jgi:hypothetical protein